MLTMAYAEMHTATFHINVLCFCYVSTSVGRFFVSGRLSGAVKKALTQIPELLALEELKNIGYELFIYIRVCFRGTS